MPHLFKAKRAHWRDGFYHGLAFGTLATIAVVGCVLLATN